MIWLLAWLLKKLKYKTNSNSTHTQTCLFAINAYCITVALSGRYVANLPPMKRPFFSGFTNMSSNSTCALIYLIAPPRGKRVPSPIWTHPSIKERRREVSNCSLRHCCFALSNFIQYSCLLSLCLRCVLYLWLSATPAFTCFLTKFVSFFNGVDSSKWMTSESLWILLPLPFVLLFSFLSLQTLSAFFHSLCFSSFIISF